MPHCSIKQAVWHRMHSYTLVLLYLMLIHPGSLCFLCGFAGTVIPAQDSVYAAANVAAFKQARGGQGFFVVGPFSGQLLGTAASVQLVKPDGTVVAST